MGKRKAPKRWNETSGAAPGTTFPLLFVFSNCPGFIYTQQTLPRGTLSAPSTPTTALYGAITAKEGLIIVKYREAGSCSGAGIPALRGPFLTIASDGFLGNICKLKLD